ncbi:MAG: hypothetical protein HN732_23795, partial [Rhodospirillaceae bacterium]|nr:hypothetical protein [Rhodospirillaceae bacterium]
GLPPAIAAKGLGLISGLALVFAGLRLGSRLGGPWAGALAAMALAALFWRASTLKERYQRAAAAGLLVSALALAHLSFGIWQTWWMAALALNGAMFAMALQLKGK